MEEKQSIVELLLVVNMISVLFSETVLFSHTKLYSLNPVGLIRVFQEPGMKYS